MNWRVAGTIASVIVLASCSDSLGVRSIPSAVHSSAAVSQGNDDAMRMRGALRLMADTAFRQTVEATNNIVIVGFKPEMEVRGVDDRGRPLLTRAEAAG